jgi:hypothetical protein
MRRDVKIERLALDLPGFSEAGARRVAQLVAEGLGAAGGLPETVHVPRLKVSIAASPGADEAALARLIIAATMRDLARTG